MPLTYEGNGIAVAYPDNWSVESTTTDGDWSVLLQSTGTAFVQLVGQVRPNGVKPIDACQDSLDATLQALRDDYPELESEPATERIAGRAAVGQDIRFISLDLTASCWVRAIDLSKQTLLILCQASDLELPIAEPVFRAIRASLRVTE